MQGIVDFMLRFPPGVSPHYFEHSRPDDPRILVHFDSRLSDLTGVLGEPTLADAAMWYPEAVRVASWKRDDKTLALILEYRDGPGEIATLLWGITDDEMNTLLEAAQSRAARVSAEEEFDRFFDRTMTRLAQRGRYWFLPFKMLVDDLALIRDHAVSLLVRKLEHEDGEIRCETVDVLLRLEGGRAVPSVLPLFNDPQPWVRWHVVGCMARYGGSAAISPLIDKLKHDSDPGLRGQAAYASVTSAARKRSRSCWMLWITTRKPMTRGTHPVPSPRRRWMTSSERITRGSSWTMAFASWLAAARPITMT